MPINEGSGGTLEDQRCQQTNGDHASGAESAIAEVIGKGQQRDDVEPVPDSERSRKRGAGRRFAQQRRHGIVRRASEAKIHAERIAPLPWSSFDAS